MRKRSVCFFAHVRNQEELRRVEFYGQDIRVLEDLGCDVQLATRATELKPADLYIAWWWTWAFIPVTYAHLRGKPVIATGVFDYWNFHERPLHQRVLIRYAIRSADTNVFVSSLELKKVPEVATVRNGRYVPCAIDTDVYHSTRVPREDFILTIATMRGPNSWRKCIEEVIEAAPIIHRRFPETHFIIAGDHEDRYPKLAKRLGAEDYVYFPGIISRAAKIDLMSRCRVYLQPSRFEGFGVAIAEALSCGAPVVTSRVGAVPEVVGDAGVFVDGTSPSEIAAGCVALLDDQERQSRLSVAGPQRIGSLFSYSRHKEAWAAIIDETLSRKKRWKHIPRLTTDAPGYSGDFE